MNIDVRRQAWADLAADRITWHEMRRRITVSDLKEAKERVIQLQEQLTKLERPCRSRRSHGCIC